MSNAKTTHTSSGDDSLWDMCRRLAKRLRAACGRGRTRLQRQHPDLLLSGSVYVVNDGEFHGPYETKDAAETAFPVFGPVNENDEGDAAIVEIWDKQYGMLFQRK